MLVGAVLDGPGPTHVSNAGVVWDPVDRSGRDLRQAPPRAVRRVHPVRGELGGLIGRFRQIPYDFAPGTGAGVLQLGPVAIGDVICYEVAYDGLVRSSVEDGAPGARRADEQRDLRPRPRARQQLAMTQVRAVEHGRAVLVASTSGISAFLEPDGRVVATLEDLHPDGSRRPGAAA